MPYFPNFVNICWRDVLFFCVHGSIDRGLYGRRAPGVKSKELQEREHPGPVREGQASESSHDVRSMVCGGVVEYLLSAM